VRGVGPAKCAEIAAAVELARRSLSEDARSRDALASPQAVRDYLRLLLSARPYEVFVGLFLDSQNRLLAADELFRGTLAQTSVYPREVVKAEEVIDYSPKENVAERLVKRFGGAVGEAAAKALGGLPGLR